MNGALEVLETSMVKKYREILSIRICTEEEENLNMK